MFKVPESLQSIDILGVQVPVIIDQSRCEHLDALGMYDGSIILKAEYEDNELFIKTLAHEAFHATCDTVGLQLDIQLEEVLAVSSERLFVSLSKTLSEMFTEMSQEDQEAPRRGRPKGSKNKPK